MEQLKEVIHDVRLSATAKNLLHRLDIKELDYNDFLRECAYWAIKDGFDDLKPRQLSQPPNKVIELESMMLSQRLRLDYSKLYAEFPQVKDYYERKLFNINYNKGILDWLKEIKNYVSEDDQIFHLKIDARILEFRAFEDELSILAEKIKETFGATEQ